VSVDALETRVLFSSPHQSPPPAGVDMVMRWNNIIMDTLRADRTLPGPGWSSRNMAIANLAIYDAVNAIDGSYQPYLSSLHGYYEHNTSMGAAVAAAAHRALVALYPGQKAMLDGQLAASLADVADGPQERRGVKLGEATASAILANRANDGSDALVPYTVNPAAGHWQPDPINPSQIAWGPGWGQVKPFALASGDQFRAPAPPDMDSAAYAAAYNEVKSLGEKNSATRSADQTQIGIFWAYDRAGTGTPPTLYCQATEVLAAQQRNSMVENARLMALMSIAQADAGIAAWDTKYVCDLWRPVTAIRRGTEDGNAATVADATWEPLGAPGGGVVADFTPPFPAYVSGHATFGAATFRMLADFYRSNNIGFTLRSDEMPGVTRSFSSFSQAAEENARSRIYLGIHWNFDATEGIAMGNKIADWVIAHALLPRTGHGKGNHAAPALSRPIGSSVSLFTSSAFRDTVVLVIGLSDDSSSLF
jgi:hypothetical protein